MLHKIFLIYNFTAPALNIDELGDDMPISMLLTHVTASKDVPPVNKVTQLPMYQALPLSIGDMSEPTLTCAFATMTELSDSDEEKGKVSFAPPSTDLPEFDFDNQRKMQSKQAFCDIKTPG